MAVAINEGLVAKVQKLGENMKIAEVKIIEADKVVGYNHGGRVAVLVGGTGDEAISRNVAMHVAASLSPWLRARPTLILSS